MDRQRIRRTKLLPWFGASVHYRDQALWQVPEARTGRVKIKNPALHIIHSSGLCAFFDGDNMITRFEKARVVAARALQISLGAPVLVKSDGLRDAAEIALKEFDEDVLPINVVRRMPDGSEEIIDISGASGGKHG
jgi:DNA-directed RNA polymerase subunit K